MSASWKPNSNSQRSSSFLVFPTDTSDDYWQNWNGIFEESLKINSFLIVCKVPRLASEQWIIIIIGRVSIQKILSYQAQYLTLNAEYWSMLSSMTVDSKSLPTVDLMCSNWLLLRWINVHNIAHTSPSFEQDKLVYFVRAENLDF